MANEEVAYDKIASQFIEYRETNNREPVEYYTIYGCMLKPLLNEHGLLTGKRVLDLACGHGHCTRQLKAFECAYILGVDLSSAMVKIARDIERQDPKGIEYIVADIKSLPLPEQPFDLVTGFYLLHYAETRDDLLEMARTIYMQLGENKHFIGIIGNVLEGDATFDKRKYGITKRLAVPSNEPVMADGTKIICTLYDNNEKPLCTFPNYYYSPATYEQVFKEAGFKAFQWIPYQCDPNDVNRAFFDDLVNSPPSVGIVATK